MPKNYEFSYQSRSQKLVLWGLRCLVAMSIASNLYYLGWLDVTVSEKLRALGGGLIGFWAYVTLLGVKVEVQELFVLPFNFFKASEFLISGIVLYSLGLAVLFF